MLVVSSFFLTATTPRHELFILHGLTIANCSLFPRVSWLIYCNVVHVTPLLKNLWWIQFSFLSLFERSFHHSCLLFSHFPFNTVLLLILFPFSLAKLAYPLSLNPFYIEYFLYCFSYLQFTHITTTSSLSRCFQTKLRSYL